MKFNSVLRRILLEADDKSRFQVFYDKLVQPNPKDPKGKGFMDFDTLKQIIFADPTTKKPENFDENGASVEDMVKVQPGKYTNWLLKNFIKFNSIKKNLNFFLYLKPLNFSTTHNFDIPLPKKLLKFQTNLKKNLFYKQKLIFN